MNASSFIANCDLDNLGPKQDVVSEAACLSTPWVCSLGRSFECHLPVDAPLCCKLDARQKLDHAMWGKQLDTCVYVAVDALLSGNCATRLRHPKIEAGGNARMPQLEPHTNIVTKTGQQVISKADHNLYQLKYGHGTQAQR